MPTSSRRLTDRLGRGQPAKVTCSLMLELNMTPGGNSTVGNSARPERLINQIMPEVALRDQ